jgi:hypothetical protein
MSIHTGTEFRLEVSRLRLPKPKMSVIFIIDTETDIDYQITEYSRKPKKIIDNNQSMGFSGNVKVA